jgi:hypothetical protein
VSASTGGRGARAKALPNGFRVAQTTISRRFFGQEVNSASSITEDADFQSHSQTDCSARNTWQGERLRILCHAGPGANVIGSFGPAGCEDQTNYGGTCCLNCRYFTGSEGPRQSAAVVIGDLPNGLQGYELLGGFNQRRMDAFKLIVTAYKRALSELSQTGPRIIGGPWQDRRLGWDLLAVESCTCTSPPKEARLGGSNCPMAFIAARWKPPRGNRSSPSKGQYRSHASGWCTPRSD